MTEIRFTNSPKSRRAWKWSNRQMRWFPMPVAEAELAIATGQAKNITAWYKAQQARGRTL